LIDLRRPADGRVLRIGHRGAAALAPENTIAAFEAALELGVDFVEFDVLEAPDGTLAVAHDPRVYRPEAPTLREVLEFFATRPEVRLHVDVKARHAAAVGRGLVEAGLVERSIATSSWPRRLRELRAAVPELTVGLTYPDDRRGIARRRLARPFVLPTVKALGKALPLRLGRWLAATDARAAMLHFAVVSPAVVARCREHGIAVWVWTVNEIELLDRLVAWGVDGVITDDPRIFGRSGSTLTA
jgi:glycerophosphoryl diester phosphodiesterase